MKDWAWPLLVVVLAMSSAVLIALHWLGLIAWPWWATLAPLYGLIALIGWALVGLDRMMYEAASPDAPDAWFEFASHADPHVDDH